MMYAYFGHHKCATQWIQGIVQAVCRELDLRYCGEHRYGRVPPLAHIDFFGHANATMQIVHRLNDTGYRGFHVIRDPRDVLISAYFSAKRSHPIYSDAFARYRERLNVVDLQEGIRLEMDRRGAEFRAMAEWDYANPRVYETRFELLTTRPYEGFERIFNFLGLLVPNGTTPSYAALARLRLKEALRRFGVHVPTGRLPHDWLAVIVRRHSFENLARRRKGQEDRSHHYRKGIPGDWVNYLHGENKARFKERWGALLINLGYEEDHSW